MDVVPVFCVSHTHRKHFLNLTTEIIRHAVYYCSDHQLLVKSQQNWLRQGVEQFAMRSINLLFLFVIRRICLRSGKSIIVPGNYRVMSFLPTMYKILPNTLLPGLTPYEEEIIGDHQREFWHNRSITDHVYCICQILEERWEYSETVHQLFIDFQESLWFS